MTVDWFGGQLQKTKVPVTYSVVGIIISLKFCSYFFRH